MFFFGIGFLFLIRRPERRYRLVIFGLFLSLYFGILDQQERKLYLNFLDLLERFPKNFSKIESSKALSHPTGVSKRIEEPENRTAEIHLLEKKSGSYYLGYWKTNNSVKIPILAHWKNSTGSKIELKCSLSGIEVKSVDHGREYFFWMKRWGYRFISLPPKKCRVLSEDSEIRKTLEEKLETRLASHGLDSGKIGIYLGLILGDSKKLSSEFRALSVQGGTLHLFAASGLHLGIFVGSVYFLLRWIPGIGYYQVRFFPLAIAWCYLSVLAFPVSLTRAFCFALGLLMGSFIFRKLRKIDLVYITLAAVAVLFPENFGSIGFFLSFSAVLGIFFLKPKLDQLLNWIPSRFLRESFSVSFSAGFATYPVSIVFFPGFSFGSCLVNFFLVPSVGLLLPFLFLLVPVFLFFPVWFTAPLSSLLEIYLTGICYFNQILAESLGFYQDWGELSLLYLFIWIATTGLILVLLGTKRNDQLDHLQIPTKSTRDRIPQLKFGLIVLWLGFFPLSYFLISREKPYIWEDKIYHVSDHSFLLYSRKENLLSLGGFCGKDFHSIGKVLTPHRCSGVESIYLEHSSCLSAVKSCISKNTSIRLDLAFSQRERKYLKSKWEKSFPDHPFQFVERKTDFQIQDTSIYFYNPDFMPTWLVRNLAKKSSAEILISLKDSEPGEFAISAKKWLGLRRDWKIIRRNDPILSHLQTEGNSRLPKFVRSIASESLGSKLFD
jgi:ComEC/Rec2-related protein